MIPSMKKMVTGSLGWLSCVVLGSCLADVTAVDSGAAVASVNDEAITLRQLEDELLRQEGVKRLRELIDSELDALDWKDLKDDDLIVKIGRYELRRKHVAIEVLRSDGAKVRSEMINITLARQAITNAGIVIDDAVLAAELDRHEQEFAEKLKAKGETVVPFSDYLRVNEQTSIKEYMQEEAFRMGAGLHELALRKARVEQADLEDHFLLYREERFNTPATVELQVLHIPYRMLTAPDGTNFVDPEHTLMLPQSLRKIYDDLSAGTYSFARAWQLFGQAYDPESEGGQVGWVPRSGQREQLGTRRIPAEVMEKAFAADVSNGPVLLPPITHPEGGHLVRVLGRRAAVRPEFADITEQVRRDFIESNLDAMARQVMNEQIRSSDIVYGELSRLIVARVRDVQNSAPAEPSPAEPAADADQVDGQSTKGD